MYSFVSSFCWIIHVDIYSCSLILLLYIVFHHMSIPQVYVSSTVTVWNCFMFFIIKEQIHYEHSCKLICVLLYMCMISWEYILEWNYLLLVCVYLYLYKVIANFSKAIVSISAFTSNTGRFHIWYCQTLKLLKI